MARIFIFLSSLLGLCSGFALGGDLVSELRGKGIELDAPEDKGYPNASVAFNLRYVVQPIAITYPKDASQVSTIVQIAEKYSTHVAARSGGHSYIANGLGGRNGSLVLDLNKYMTKITYDSSPGTATIATGNRLGNVALTLGKSYKRAMPHGTCPYVGIGGLAAYGGFGFTSRMWGLTLDTIKSMEVVLANGTEMKIDEKTYPELFWGMRGAAPSLAIATSLTVQTYPAPSNVTIFEYWWDLDADTAAKAFGSYQKFAVGNTPLQFGSELRLEKGKSLGKVSVRLFGGWYAPNSTLGQVVKPFLDKMPPRTNQKFTIGSYLESAIYLGEINRLNTTGIPDEHNTLYAKSLMTPVDAPMGAASQKAFMKYLTTDGYKTNLSWFIGIEQFAGVGSKINAVPLNATAFGMRNVLFTFQFYVHTPNKRPPFPSEGFTLLDGMVKSITDHEPAGWKIGGFPNYIDDRLKNWQQMYYGTHYQRLRKLKGQVDPKNMFQAPLTIEPPVKQRKCTLDEESLPMVPMEIDQKCDNMFL